LKQYSDESSQIFVFILFLFFGFEVEIGGMEFEGRDVKGMDQKKKKRRDDRSLMSLLSEVLEFLKEFVQ